MTQVNPRIFVIILNWNGKNDTLKCIASLQKIIDGNITKVLVDNGSSDGTLVAVKKLYPDITILENGKNLGFAGGNNVGMQYAIEHGADYVLVLNNDTTMAPDLIKKLVLAADKYPEAGVFGARILYMEQPDVIWFDKANWDCQTLKFDFPSQGKKEVEVGFNDHQTDYVCGAALFFRAEVAKKIGYFDERFFLVYEENDWCHQAKRAGFDCMVIPSAKIWHAVGSSFGSEESPLRLYFSIRNQLLWAKKNMPFRIRAQLVYRIFKRLFPAFQLQKIDDVNLYKRFAWGVSDFISEIKKRQLNPKHIALRRAFFDYTFQKFGDCPQIIRELNKQWQEEAR